MIRSLLFFCCILCPVTGDAQNAVNGQSARWRKQAARVIIDRDNWGIAHVNGKTDADAVFGLLYAQCEENFSKVEENNLEMLGRLSELKGPGELYNDLEMRLIYDSAAAQADFLAAPGWLKSLCIAAADGVNFFLYKHPEVRPAVLRHFEPWYQLMRTNGSISATQDGGITAEDLKALYPVPGNASVSAKMQKREAGPADPPGSNGFALGKARTASGNAILYINPHVSFYFRSEVQVTSGEGLNVYGAVTWGTFFVFQGFNEYGGWMHTSGMADVADLYAEKTIFRNDSVFTETDGRMLPVSSRDISIRCHTPGADSAYRFRLYHSFHGPVMGIRDGHWLSLREKNRSLEALEQSWLRTKTKGFAGFREVMNLRSNTSDNTVYADNKGNIAYWHGNFIPHRDARFDYSSPLDGSISATDWKNSYALDSIVHVYNPASGFIQNCNSDPFTVSGSSSPVRNDYPVWMAPDGENFRGLNAASLLAKAYHFTIDSMILNVGYNPRLLFFDSLLPTVFRDWATLDDSDTLKSFLREPVQLLKSWNRCMSDSPVALAVGVEFGYRLLALATPPASRFRYGHNVETLQQIIRNSTPAERLTVLSRTLRAMTALYGDWRMPWGSINRYQRLPDGQVDDAKPSLPSALAPSDFGAVPAFGSRRANGQSKRYGYYGNSFVACIEFGKRITAKTIITGGQSFNPSSPHFMDQADGYLHGRFKTIYFYPEDLTGHISRKYHPGD